MQTGNQQTGLSKLEKKKIFLVQLAYYGAIIALLYLFLRYLLPPLSPFVAGFVIAWFLNKPAKALGRKLHLPVRIPAFLLAIVFFAIVFVAAMTAGLQIISALEHFVPQLPSFYATQIVPFISASFDELEVALAEYDPAIVDLVDRILTQLFTYIGQLVSNLSLSMVKLISSIITGLPSVILSVILTVVSTFFISLDFDSIIAFCKRCLPARMRTTVSETVTTGVSSIQKILISYIVIMLMSFCELSIGFLLLDVPYAVGLALLVAVIDIMPILGTGLVLIPWAIIAAVLRNFRMAVGVALLYIVMLAVRNVVEPKLVGKQMGLHPLVTLISMFLGLQLFGIAGLFGFPIALSLFIKLRASRSREA